MNKISLGILVVLRERHEIRGMDELACAINAHPRYVKTNALLLAALGLIEIIPGSQGRGHKTIFRDAGALNMLEKQS